MRKFLILLFFTSIHISFIFHNEFVFSQNKTQGFIKENLGKIINSEFDEIAPIISPDGSTLYFVRDNHPENCGKDKLQDIWFSKIDSDGRWGKPVNVGYPLNNNYPNFVTSISADGCSLFLGNSYKKDSVVGKGISITSMNEYGMEYPKSIEITNYYNLSKMAFFNKSLNNKYLLMSIKRTDSFGEEDIYVSFSINDTLWSEPLNLGSIINTNGSEITPFLATDDLTLYFSSNRKESFGDYDIFFSKRLDDTWQNWTEPVNLGIEYNSKKADAYFYLSNFDNYAYFVSNDNSYGGSDIFRIKLKDSIKPEKMLYISGKVIVLNENKRICSEIIIETFPDGTVFDKIKVNNFKNSFSIILPLGKNYGLRAECDKYYSEYHNIDVRNINENLNINLDIFLYPLVAGQRVRLNNIFFDLNKATLKSESYAELNRVADLLKTHTNLKIEIAGFTDTLGSKSYNLRLSEQRARAVAEYLQSTGISEKRIKFKGYGEELPSIEENNKIFLSKNRKVEFRITED